MNLSVVEERDLFIHVKLEGRLDATGEQDIRDELLGLAAQGNSMLVDMANVSFLGSVGLGLLFRCAKLLIQNGARMTLLSPQPVVEQILHSSGVTDVIILNYEYDRAVRYLTK